jgi:hypothetical protein
MYKLIQNFEGQIVAVSKTFDGSRLTIPFDNQNTDYVAYLAWCAEGNEVLPPDEPQQEQ